MAWGNWLVVAAVVLWQPPATEEKEYTGVAEPARIGHVQSRLRARAGGTTASTIVALMVEEGQMVRQGEVLLRLDDREAMLELKQAEVGYATAKAELAAVEQERAAQERCQRLRLEAAKERIQNEEQLAKGEGGPATRTLREAHRNLELLAAEAEAGKAKGEAAMMAARGKVHLAELAIERAKLQLEQCMLMAPLNGVVYFSEGSAPQVGDAVREGERLMLVCDASVVNVRFNVPARDAAKVKVGQPVELTLGNGLALQSRVERVIAGVQGVTVLARGPLLQEGPPVRSGSPVKVKLRIQQ